MLKLNILRGIAAASIAIAGSAYAQAPSGTNETASSPHAYQAAPSAGARNISGSNQSAFPTAASELATTPSVTVRGLQRAQRDVMTESASPRSVSEIA